METNIEFLKQNLIAHRGMHDISKGIPENSIKAFELAIENNYTIELDLHILKDNNIVVFHDDNLKRMTGIDKELKNTTYNEIKNLKLLNTDNYIPLFKDVLEFINGRVPILIELKYDVKVGRLEQGIIDILKQYKGKYAIQSFNPFSVYWFTKRYPNIIRGQLSSNFKKEKMSIIKKNFLKNMFFNFLTKPDFISYDINALPNKRVKKLKNHKLILVWTIRSKKDMEKAKKYCDSLICENLEQL